MRTGSDEAKRLQVVEQWYRDQVKTATANLVARWEPAIGVDVEGFYVQRMKTRWGSCNSLARTIRLNTDLARKPRECLEYIEIEELYGSPLAPPESVVSVLPNLLHRPSQPSASEVSGWLNSGQDLLAIDAAFAGSSEYFSLASTFTGGVFV